MTAALSSSQNAFKILEDLWESEDFADVVFYVGEEPDVWRIAAHKMVLSKCSPVFTKMFYGSLKDSSETSEITISDIQPEIFDELLKFIYTNKVNPESIDEAILLFKAAHKYMIAEAVRAFVKYLCSSLNAQNVLKVYNCLDCYMDETDVLPLQAACIEIIDKKGDDVFKSKAFLYLKPELVFNLTARETLKLSNELILFEALLRWVQLECKRRHLSPTMENKRNVLGSSLFNVRFGLLESLDILRGPVKSGLITEKDKEKFLNCSRIEFDPAVCRIKNWSNVNYERFDDFHRHALAFKSNRNLILTKIFLTANHNLIKRTNKCMFNLLQNKDIILDLKLNENVQTAVHANILVLSLPCPVLIKANKKYVLYALMEAGVSIKEGTFENPSVWCSGSEQFKIIWEECELPAKGENSTTLKSGQLFFLQFIIPLENKKEAVKDKTSPSPEI